MAQRATIKRPVKLLKGKETPRCSADGIYWKLTKSGDFIFDHAGLTKVKIPVETLSYIRPLFEVREVTIKIEGPVNFYISSANNHPRYGMHPLETDRIMYRKEGGEWYYLTKVGFKSLWEYVQKNGGVAAKTLKRVGPCTDFEMPE